MMKNDNAMKKHDNSLHCMTNNLEFEAILKLASGADNFNDMTIKCFSTIKMDLLKSFVRARMIEDLWKSNDKDTPNMKGKESDAHAASPPVLIEVAHEMRNNAVAAKDPVPPALSDDAIKNISTPSITKTKENCFFSK